MVNTTILAVGKLIDRKIIFTKISRNKHPILWNQIKKGG